MLLRNENRKLMSMRNCYFILIVINLCAITNAESQVTETVKSVHKTFSGKWEGKINSNVLEVILENSAYPGNNIKIKFGINEIAGLTDGTPNTFHVKRDAGTMNFEGLLNGIGQGNYFFTPNAFFVAHMKEENLAVSEAEQINYFFTNVTKLYVKMLKKHGYGQLKKAELIKLAEQGVGKKDAHALADEPAPPGMESDSLSTLVNFKLLGITEEYIKSFEEAGYKDIPAGTLVNFKSTGITPAFIQSFQLPGMKPALYSDLINFKLVGVTPEYIQSFNDAGYADISYTSIVNLKAAGVEAPKK